LEWPRKKEEKKLRAGGNHETRQAEFAFFVSVSGQQMNLNIADLLRTARPGRNLAKPRVSAPATELPKNKDCVVCAVAYNSEEVLTCAKKHHTCFTCIASWVSSACQPEEMYFQEITTRHGVCHAGEIPCPRFLGGECRVACLPMEDIMRALLANPQNTEAFQDYMRATRALAEMQAYKDFQQHQAREAAAAAASNPVQRAHDAVMNAISEAMIRRCPSCRVSGGIKDDMCTHIACSCGQGWCYTCEAPDGDCRERWDSPFLDQNVGWNNFARGNESPAEGAVYEFLRRIAACRIREIKVTLNPTVWEQLKERHPDLLKNIIHGDRQISWEEIDTATWPGPVPREPPVFEEPWDSSAQNEVAEEAAATDTENPSSQIAAYPPLITGNLVVMAPVFWSEEDGWPFARFGNVGRIVAAPDDTEDGSYVVSSLYDTQTFRGTAANIRHMTAEEYEFVSRGQDQGC
jgi:hypothetical protein